MRSLSICLAAVFLFATSTFAEHNALLPRPQQLLFTDYARQMYSAAVAAEVAPALEELSSARSCSILPWGPPSMSSGSIRSSPPAWQVRTREVLSGWKPGEPFPPVSSLRPKP